ncbi:MAG TPA: SDR family oxidoreductase [Chthoniobacterales bacterium]
MKHNQCTALITGASAGIGWEFARQLAPSAKLLVLVARRQERLEQLRNELSSRHPKLEIHIRAVDLSDPEQLKGLTDWLTTNEIDLDLLINNAGIGALGPVAVTDPRRLEQIVLVNINALTLLTRAVLPGMISRNHGAILNVSSCASFLPIPGFAVYAASKAYVTSFTEALRTELRATNITVSALCPGPVHTEFTGVAHPSGTQHYPAPEFVHVAVEKVVRMGLAGVERNQPIVIPGVVMRIAMFITRMTPMPILRLTSRRSQRGN